MINSVRENNSINNTKSIPAQQLPEEVKTIKQVFNDTVSEKTESQETNLPLKESHGFEIFDKAVQNRDISLARDIMLESMEDDWKLIQEACKKAELIDQTIPQVPLQDQETLKSFCSRGYEGHNNLLIRAINASDYKAFIRTCMDSEDGSWRIQQDPKTLRNLFHLAAAAGQKEMIYFLLLQEADLELADKDGLTIKQVAVQKGRQDLVDFFDICQVLIEYKKNPTDALKEKIESISDARKQTLETIVGHVEDYIGVYTELQATYYAEDGKLTDEGKAIKDFARHGIVWHEEMSQGHNGLVIESIAKGNLEKLAFYVKMGASLDTLSARWQKAIQDPHSYVAAYTEFMNESMRTFTQETKESFFGEDPTMWDRNLGVGKTLLDMAVLYSNEKQDNLDVIAYLMHKGLNPFRTNDEGESPFSMALSKGNLKAAVLMMQYQEISEETIPDIDKETLDKAFLILKQGAQMRDPLYVSSSKAKAGFFTGTYLLAHMLANQFHMRNIVLEYINLFSFFRRTFMVDELTFREKLNIKSDKNLYLPDIIKKIYPIAAQASILEIAAFPQYSIGSLFTTAVGVYGSASSTFSSMQTASKYIAERPLSAMYKVGMDLLPTAQSVMWFTNYFNSLIYYPTLQWLLPVDLNDYQNTNIVQRLDSPNLNPNLKEHAKVILEKWNQTAFEDNPSEYLDGLLGNASNTLDNARLYKLSNAYQTLYRPEPEVSFYWDTAYKGAVVFAANIVNFNSWQPLAKASIAYHVIRGLIGV